MPFTASVTGIVCALLSGLPGVIVMEPLYVAPAERPTGLTETKIAPGVAPLAGATESQEPPEATAV